jgi:hypothetical protein
MRGAFRCLFLVCLTPVLAPAGQAAERRCDRLHDRTSTNCWLQDRGGEWLLSLQRGPPAPGMDDAPDMASRSWIAANGRMGMALVGHRALSRRCVTSFPAPATPLFATCPETGLVPRCPTAILATGMVLPNFLSLASGLMLDGVSRARPEAKRPAHPAQPPQRGDDG